MDVNDRIRQELATSPVVLFMKGTPEQPQCGFSAQTVAVLQRLGARFHSVNIFDAPELREELKRFSNWPTYPQLYVNGELVGVCDIALGMYRNGELQQVLASAGVVAGGSWADGIPPRRRRGRELSRRYPGAAPRPQSDPEAIRIALAAVSLGSRSARRPGANRYA